MFQSGELELSIEEKIVVLQSKLKAHLSRAHGSELSLKVLKEVLVYSSIDAVAIAITKGHLNFSLNGCGLLRGRTVTATALSAYIAEQYAKALHEKHLR